MTRAKSPQRRKNTVSLLATLPLLLTPAALHAQTTTGSVAGTITDQTGAVVPGATVVLTNLGTDAKRTIVADRNGTYLVGNLIPGQYREDVDLTGFKHYTRESITVEVEAALRIDVAMQVGATSEVVEVSTETPLLQAESPSLSQVVNAKTVEEMPLNGRNVNNLIALTPGVVAQGGTAGAAGSNQSAGHTNLAGFNNYAIGGAQPGQSASFIDGVPINQLGGNTIALIITQDAVDEFRVSTNGASAEFGRFGGGVINFATKSGVNQFHGSAYEYFRNRALNASGYFAKHTLTPAPKPAYNQNQYGGTFGGPIKKDKLFFFTSYEQYKILTGSTLNYIIPTLAERMGNFAADTTTLPHDPYTGVPFAGGVILPNRFDPAGAFILNNYFPTPNVTGQSYNFTTTVEPGAQSKQATGRADYNVSEKQHAFLRYTYWDLNDIPLNAFKNLTGGAGSDQITHEGVLGDTYSFSAKTTGDLRLSYTRGYYDDRPINTNTNYAQYSPAYATLASQITVGLPVNATISGLTALNGMTANSRQTRNTYAVAPSVTRLFGSHNVKVGADLRLLQFNYLSPTNPGGTFAFDTSFTGNAIAAVLLGVPTSGNIGTAAEVGQYSYYQGYYATDTWQANRKLTVSAGLRYELPGAWSERMNHSSVLLPNQTNTLANGAAVKGELAVVGTPAYSPNTTEQVKHDLFAPRLGVIFSPVEKTVLRAGYSIAYLPFDAYDGGSPFISPLNSATTNYVATAPGSNIPLNTLSDPFPAGGVPGTLQQSILQPAGRSQAYLDNLRGLSITGAVPTHRVGYDQQWNASLQQEFPGNTVFQAAYAGNRGTFLPLGNSYSTGSVNNLNQLPDQYDACNPTSYPTAAALPTQCGGNYLLTKVGNQYVGALNPTGSLDGATVNFGQTKRPFPQYQNVIQSNAAGDSIYHSLQTSVVKRFRNGGVINSNYTWAKNIGNVSGTTLTQLETQGTVAGVIQDFTNLHAERSELNFSVRNRFVTSFVSDLPFGKGHQYLANASGIEGGFVSGWGVNGIVTFQTGYLLSLQAQNNQLSNNFGAGTIRPDFNPAGSVSTTTNGVTTTRFCNNQKAIHGSAQSRLGGVGQNPWFNTACFSAPGGISTPANNYFLGNESRVDTGIHAAGVANYDFSIKKDTGLGEHMKLDLRLECFNLFNRVQFSTPAITQGVAAFGTVTAAQNQPRNIQLSGRIEF